MLVNELLEAWSAKYKRSINCNNPKGFSQKAHCAGRKKTEADQNRFVKQDNPEDIVMFCRFENQKRKCSNVARKDIQGVMNRLIQTAEMVNGTMMDVYTDPLGAPDQRSIVTFTKEIDGKMYKVWADQNTKKIIKKEPL